MSVLAWRPRCRVLFPYPRLAARGFDLLDRAFVRALQPWAGRVPGVVVLLLRVPYHALVLLTFVAAVEVTIVACTLSLYAVAVEWIALLICTPVMLVTRRTRAAVRSIG